MYIEPLAPTQTGVLATTLSEKEKCRTKVCKNDAVDSCPKCRKALCLAHMQKNYHPCLEKEIDDKTIPYHSVYYSGQW